MDWEKAWKRKILKIKEKIVKRKNSQKKKYVDPNRLKDQSDN